MFRKPLAQVTASHKTLVSYQKLHVQTATISNLSQYPIVKISDLYCVQPKYIRIRTFPSSLSTLAAGGGCHERFEHLEGGPVVGHVQHQLDLLLPFELVHRSVVPVKKRWASCLGE